MYQFLVPSPRCGLAFPLVFFPLFAEQPEEEDAETPESTLSHLA